MNRSWTMLTGLVLLGLLAAADTAGLLLTDGKHPPIYIAAIGTVLGVASLVLLVVGWRGSRAALHWLVGLRVISAATAVPAFVVDGVPAAVQLLVVAIIVATLVGCALVLAGLRRRLPTVA